MKRSKRKNDADQRDAEQLLPNARTEAIRKMVVWSEVWASVPGGAESEGGNSLKDKKCVLRDVYGVALPGEILAIMGGSGAGKTTLLNILTRNAQSGVEHTGLVLVNGEQMNEVKMRRMAAFVQQIDLFCGALTVKEQLQFSASLRMGRQYTRAQREERVEEVIKEMNLTECQDTMIGISGRVKGISVGERKRLSFACELLTDPSIMFCDEPTSGLDSFMAQQVVTCLQRLAERGKTIITVIHQPSVEVFKMFHKVCFLANGKTAYHGSTERIINYLEATGDPQFHLPFDRDLADHMITLLSIEPKTREYDIRRIERLTDTFEQSEHGELLRQLVDGDVSGSLRIVNRSGNDELLKNPKYASSFISQFCELFKRSLRTSFRDPMLVKIKLVQVILTALVIGIVNFRLEVRGVTVQSMEGAIYSVVRDMNGFFLYPALNVITAELPLFLREHKARIYSVDSYYWAKMFAELPQFVMLPFVYALFVYWMVGLNPTVVQFAKYVLVCILLTNVSASIGITSACILGEEGLAISIIPLITLPIVIFAGFYINFQDIPPYYQWAGYLSWSRYGFDALQINQWLHYGNISDCVPPCATKDGIAVLKRQGMQTEDWFFWLDIGVLTAMIAFARVIGLLALKIRAFFAK